jgi:hypothetical protein
MDLVYPCRSGPNAELKFSLRSIANLPYDSLWLYGDAPQWYKGNLVRLEPASNKHASARANLIAAANDDRLSREIIVMNDDFFVMKQVERVGVYHGGLLKDKLDYFQRTWPLSKYSEKLRYTYKMLREAGIDKPLDYELHVPLVVNRSRLAGLFRKYKRGMWRSLYGNLNRIGGIEIEDVKIYPRSLKQVRRLDYMNASFPYLSTTDKAFSEIRLWIGSQFPTPSQYEK